MINSFLNNIKFNKGKDFYSLLLALLLIFSISGKIFDPTYPDDYKLSKHHSKSLNKNKKTSIFNVELEEDDSLTEVDVEDDIEEYLSNYSLIRLFFFYKKAEHSIVYAYKFYNYLKQPFYILYCNWKFDLVS